MDHHGHADMSMDKMADDMRNRFLVAAVLSVPILLWSAIGRQVLHFTVPAPFGLRDDLFQLILSLPVIGYSARIFFDGAVRALRARTLDMMVLVAVAIAFICYGRRAADFERITLSAQDLSIERAEGARRLHWHFPTVWARVEVEESGSGWMHRVRVFIVSRGERVEVGRHLAAPGRKLLAQEIFLALRNTAAA